MDGRGTPTARRGPRRLPSLGVLAALLLLAGALRAQPDEAPEPATVYVAVPDVRRLTPAVAARVLARAGLRAGRIYEVAVPAGWQLGLVVQQAPTPTTPDQPAGLPWGSPVLLRVSATADGPAAGRLPPADWPVPPARPPSAPATEPAATNPPAAPPPPPPSEAPRAPATPPASTSPAPTPPPQAPTPSPEPGSPDPASDAAPGSTPPVAPPAPRPAAPDEGPAEAPAGAAEPAEEEDPAAVPREAEGSPDAPAVAPPGDPMRVPDLVGLALADAEQRALEAEMTLYVERVAGHPVGRVLEQAPPAGTGRPSGGVVRIVVTAGGDHAAAVPPAPAVAVDRVAVPDLLDRTGPQAERILEDLGLLAERHEAERGPAGRVADQRPAAGTVVAKGTTVAVWVAPGSVGRTRPGSRPAPGRPGGAAPAPGPAPGPADPVPGPAPAEGARPAAPQGAAPPPPAPRAPQAGTPLGADRTLDVGFTWQPAPGADVYVLEVEERGPDGWIPIARRTTRKAAAVLEIERTCPAPGVLRWRVAGIAQGRQGPYSAWVELR